MLYFNFSRGCSKDSQAFGITGREGAYRESFSEQYGILEFTELKK